MRAAFHRIWEEQGQRLDFTRHAVGLIEVLLDRGEVEDARRLMTEARQVVGETDELYLESELLRLEGELVLAEAEDGSADSAETLFQKALERSRDKGTHSLGLRAALSLARLWRDQGRLDEAQRLLGEACERFPEDADSVDLKTARELLVVTQ